MRQLPLVSVVITTYNQDRYITRTVDSVLAQDVADMEVIILDDCSTDATETLLAAYRDDPRVEYVRHPRNIGAKANNSLALTSGRGRYLAWLSGDDFFLPGHLRMAIEALESNTGCCLAYSPCFWVDEEDRIKRLAVHPGHVGFSYAGGRNEVAELLAWDNYITPSAALFRRSDLQAVGTLNPDIRAADWELFLRMALHNPDFVFINTPTTAYRIHAEQVSSAFYALTEPLRTHLHVLEMVLDSPWGGRLDQHRERIASHLESRVMAYPPGKVEPLQAQLRRTLGKLGAEPAAVAAADSEQPLVSVIVPTKDRPELLQDTLESVNAQQYGNWEVVVVNDGGADVEALVRSLDRHGRFRYLRHETSRGLSAARNTGIRFSRGDILCYLDDDDTFRPQHLQTVVDALCREQREFVYTEAEYIQERLEEGRRVETGRGTPYSGIEYSPQRLLVANFIPVNTWAHRRGLLARTGLFDPELNALEDWDMLIRCSQATDILHIPELTVEVHLREDAGDGHMMARERKNFPELFRRIYARYTVDGQPDIEASRSRQLAALEQEGPEVEPAQAAYASWMEHHALREIDGELIAERMMVKWKVNPSLHFIVALMDGQMSDLAATLDSLAGQLYQGWGLTVLSEAACPDPLFEEAPNLEWVQSDDEVAAAVDAVVAGSQADWIGVLEAGDRLESVFTHALADYINLHPEWAFVYVDEDLIDAEGNRHSPSFKPDFNLDLLRSRPYLGSFCLVRRELLHQAGPLRFVDQPLYTHDLALKVANLCDEQVFGHVASLLFHRLDSNAGRFSGEQLDTALRLCVSDHLDRAGIPARVGEGLLPGTTRVVYLHQSRPPVSIIIPSRDRLDLITPCVESLLEHTDWPDFEILIVDNGSESDDTYEYYDRLVAKHGERVRVLSLPGPFNFSALNNLGAREARGEYLLLLNNDTQVLHDDWLERMMAHAQRPDVGITGPRLVFGDHRLQHAGVVLGLSEVAGHIGYREPMDSPRFNGRLQSDQNYSAVTGACLLIRKSVYEEVGGLDEEALGVMYNDIDLCLKVRERGYRIVWTPYVTLIHHSSCTLGDPVASPDDRERLEAETAAFMGRWSAHISADPAYNRNLSLTHYDGRPEGDIDANWDTSFHDRPRILAYPLDGMGCGFYRVYAPLWALEGAGKAQVGFLPSVQDQKNRHSARLFPVAEMNRLAPDTFLMQSTVYDHQLAELERFAKFSDVFKVFDLDDLKTHLPDRNSLRQFMLKDMKTRLRKALGFCDRLIVSTEPLAEAYGDMIDDVLIVPNYLSRERWGGLQSRRRRGRKPRVGWAGAQQHHGDLELLIPVVEALEDEVEWVFFGMCLDELRPYAAEVHEFVSTNDYPAKLASLDLDLALAPLEIHPFNEAKSHLRLLEYGVMGWPVICTDIHPYRDGPVLRLPNEPARWIEAIRERIHDLDATAREGDRLRRWVEGNWFLEDNLDTYLAALLPGTRLARGARRTGSAGRG